jgi:uncharacterized membrane protein
MDRLRRRHEGPLTNRRRLMGVQGGEVLHTSLSQADEEEIRAALNAHQAATVG